MTDSPVAAWTLARTRVFLDWLAREAPGRGFISEFGIPSGVDSAKWAQAADLWLNAIGSLGAAQWVSGGFENRGTFRGITDSHADRNADTIDITVAPLLRSRGGVRAVSLGIVAGGSIPPGFCAANPRGQVLPNAATIRFVASLGIKTVRLPFRWESIQPVRRAALEPGYLAKYQAAVAACDDVGMKVIVDLHNFASYVEGTSTAPIVRRLGDGNLTTDDLTDVWGRLSAVFRGDPRVYAYELMNEPYAMPGGAPAWQDASQALVSSLRAAGDMSLLLVSGYDYQAASRWVVNHPASWITDPIDRFLYCAHAYWSTDPTGDAAYTLPWAIEISRARNMGYTAA
jgi:hypothetical protein